MMAYIVKMKDTGEKMAGPFDTADEAQRWRAKTLRGETYARSEVVKDKQSDRRTKARQARQRKAARDAARSDERPEGYFDDRSAAGAGPLGAAQAARDRAGNVRQNRGK